MNFDSFFIFLQEKTSISQQGWEAMLSILSEQKISKGDFILTEGQICQKLCFVKSGAFRAFYLQDGKEINNEFFLENSIATDHESLTTQQPSRLYLEALEPVSGIVLHRDDLIELYKLSPDLQAVGRDLLSLLLIERNRYASLFTLNTPTERYHYLLENRPDILERIPLQFIASYLGMARETLSRIRRKIS